jgi:hypothetical protein
MAAGTTTATWIPTALETPTVEAGVGRSGRAPRTQDASIWLRTVPVEVDGVRRRAFLTGVGAGSLAATPGCLSPTFGGGPGSVAWDRSLHGPDALATDGRR